MARNDTQVNFRMPAELKARLEAVCAKPGARSMTAEIVYWLDKVIPHGDAFTQFKLRIPTPLHARIVEASVSGNRSINAEIVRRLEQTFAAEV